MSDLLAEQLKNDVTGFEMRVAGLNDRKGTLLHEIDQVEAEIKQIEPLSTYAKGLLGRSISLPRTAAATLAAAEARKKKASGKEAAEVKPENPLV